MATIAFAAGPYARGASASARKLCKTPRALKRFKSDGPVPSTSRVHQKDTPQQPAVIQDPPVPSLPFLQRPLGVLDRPTTRTRTWEDTKLDMMDQAKRMADRKHILKEVGTGYFHDLSATRTHGGKTWIAPQVLIREDKALYFPDIVGTTLDEAVKAHTTHICQGKISVISVLTSRISELHAEAFTSQTNEAFLSHPSYQYVQINLQDNVLKNFLVNMFLRSIRSHVPPHLHPTYLVSSQNMEYLRKPLGISNKHIGYVYLVDENLRIRWAGGGDAKDEESEGLKRCTKVLLDRMEKTKEEEAQAKEEKKLAREEKRKAKA